MRFTQEEPDDAMTNAEDPHSSPDNEAASRVAQLREEASIHVKEHEMAAGKHRDMEEQHNRAAGWWRLIRDCDEQAQPKADSTVRGKRDF